MSSLKVELKKESLKFKPSGNNQAKTFEFSVIDDYLIEEVDRHIEAVVPSYFEEGFEDYML